MKILIRTDCGTLMMQIEEPAAIGVLACIAADPSFDSRETKNPGEVRRYRLSSDLVLAPTPGYKIFLWAGTKVIVEK